MKKCYLIIICAFLGNSVIAQEIQLDRYSTQEIQPSELNKTPLDVLIHIKFPRDVVKSVSDAVQYVLIRTGYTLNETTDATVNTVFSKRLPESHREIGTSTVVQVLETLLGNSFVLKVDHSLRTIRYEPVSATDAVVQQDSNHGTK